MFTSTEKIIATFVTLAIYLPALWLVSNSFAGEWDKGYLMFPAFVGIVASAIFVWTLLRDFTAWLRKDRTRR